MAKALPYFKFFCSEWSDGDITLEDYKTQGLFINICAYYWSNECVVELSKLKKKFRGYESTIDEILTLNIIKLKGDFISISFLDEQQIEREEQSKIKSKGGLASVEARKLLKLQQKTNNSLTENQQVLNSGLTEVQLLRKDKIREEKNSLHVGQENLPNPKPSIEKIDFKKLTEFLNKATGRNLHEPNQTVKNKYIARMKEGVPKSKIITAIINACKDPYHIETNFKYLTMEFFSRADKIELHGSEKINEPIKFKSNVK